MGELYFFGILVNLVLLVTPAHSFDRLDISQFVSPSSVTSPGHKPSGIIIDKGASEGILYHRKGVPPDKELYLVKPSGGEFDDFGDPFPYTLPPKYNTVKETCVTELYGTFIGHGQVMHDDLVVDSRQDHAYLVGSQIIPNFHNSGAVPPGTKNVEINLLTAILLGEIDKNTSNYGFTIGEPNLFYKIDHGYSLNKFDGPFSELPRNKSELLHFIRTTYAFSEETLPDSAITEAGVEAALHKIASVPNREIYNALSKCLGYFDPHEFDEKDFYLNKIFPQIIRRKNHSAEVLKALPEHCVRDLTNFRGVMHTIEAAHIQTDTIGEHILITPVH